MFPNNIRNLRELENAMKTINPGIWYVRYSGYHIAQHHAVLQRYDNWEWICDSQGQLGWQGTIKGRYEVAIWTSDNFPYVSPKAFLLSPKICAQHIFEDGFMCVIRTSDWNPSYSIATFIGMACATLDRYENHAEHCRKGTNGQPCFEHGCKFWTTATRNHSR